MKSWLSVILVLMLPLPGSAYGWSLLPLTQQSPDTGEHVAEASEPAQTVAGSPQSETESPRPALVDSALVSKKVVVHFRDGRVQKGKLLEVTDDFLRLKTGSRTEQIFLTEVAHVERQRSRVGFALAITGLAIAAVAVGVLIAASQD